MKRTTLLVTVTAVTAALLVGFSTPGASAQGRRNRGGNGGAAGGNGAAGQNGGGFGQPGGRGGRFATIDPTRSSITTLLKRDDVKSEILLSQRQGEEMTAAETKDQDDLNQKVQAARPDRNAMQNLSQEDRRAAMQEARQKMNDIRKEAGATMDADLDKKAQEVLKPEQIKRLKELDLQYRGPLALADTKVAEQFNLTAEQKTQIAAILADYRKSEQATQQETYAAMGGGRGRRNRGGNAAGGAPAPGAPADPNAPATPAPAGPNAQAAPAAPAPLDPAAFEAKLTEAQGKIDKSRQDAGDKIVALLTDEQKTAWKAAQGKKFTFRKLDKTAS